MAIKTSKQIRDELNEKINACNVAFHEDKEQPHTIDDLKEDAKELTAQMIREVFAEWRNSDTPMKTALEKLYVPTASVKLNKDNNSGVKSYEIVDREKVFDMDAFVKFCSPNRITHDVSYVGRLGTAQVLFAARIAKEIGDDPKNVINLHKLPKALKRDDVTQVKDPTSNKTLETALQTLCDAIYFDESNPIKIRSKDVKFLVYRVTKASRNAYAINTGKAKTLLTAITVILSALVFGRDYVAEFDRIKED